jgi:hypothetical protein
MMAVMRGRREGEVGVYVQGDVAGWWAWGLASVWGREVGESKRLVMAALEGA